MLSELQMKLEPDIARYFKNSKQVNLFLREHIREIELGMA